MKQVEDVHHFNSEIFLTRIKNRENEAVTLLVRTYTEQLFRAAIGLGFTRQDAQELVQTVWATFFEALPKFLGKSHIRTFIFGILYNKASELRRQNIRNQSNDEIDDIMESRFDKKGAWINPPLNPEDFLIATQDLKLIDHCLKKLPLNQRMAFILKELEEKETEEICKILDITVTNLGVLLYRAKNRLRECLENKVSLNRK